MFDLPSPMFQSIGMYQSSHSAVFIEQEYSQDFLELWKLLQPQFDIHDKPGKTMVDFEGQFRRDQNFWKFQLLTEDEQLEFLHWLSIEIHEYVHVFDFFSSNFGLNQFHNRYHQTCKFCIALTSCKYPPKIPLLKKEQNSPEIDNFINEYTSIQRNTDIIIGNKLKIGKIITEDNQGWLFSFLPADRGDFSIPLPGINLSFLGISDEKIPLTTKHILEARAFLAQVAYISRWFGAQYGKMYWERLREKAFKDSSTLDYILAIMVINSYFGEGELPTQEIVFAILDFSLQFWPSEGKSFDSIYPPILLLHILTKLKLSGKNHKNIKLTELREFIEKDTPIAPIKEHLYSLKNDISNRVGRFKASNNLLDRFRIIHEEVQLSFISFRLQSNSLFLSPEDFTEFGLKTSFPKAPINILRSQDFTKLRMLCDKKRPEFVDWYFMQSIMEAVLKNENSICPLQLWELSCDVRCEECIKPMGYVREGNCFCNYGHVLNSLRLI